MSRKVILELDEATNEKVEQYQKDYEKITGKKIKKPEAVLTVIKSGGFPATFNKVQDIDLIK